MPLFIKNTIILAIMGIIIHLIIPVFAGVIFHYTFFICTTINLVIFFIIYIILLVLNFFFKNFITDNVLMIFNIYFNSWLASMFVLLLLDYFLKKLSQGEISVITHNLNLITGFFIFLKLMINTSKLKKNSPKCSK
jgi:hypothetical protein